jgi:pyruvate/2-oxoglutarate dehydrogenase complex dihydrolipoamide dehydrogenase (E3) component
MTDQNVKRAGRKALLDKRPMSRVNRAIERGDSHRFMKVIVASDASEILRAGFPGLNADEAVHWPRDVMHAHALHSVVRRAVHIHPSVSELIPTMLGELKSLDVQLILAGG